MIKKILIISNSIVGKTPGVTGGESRFIELARCWQKEGYEIHLMSARSGETLCSNMGLKVILHNISNSTRIDRFEFVLRFFKVLAYLPRLTFEFKNGIVYSASEQIYDVLPGFVLKLLHSNNIKFGVVVHWLPPVAFWKRENSTFTNSLLFLISERLGLFFANINANVLLPVSVDTLASLKRFTFFRKPAEFVLCGVNLDEINLYISGAREKNYDAVFMKRVQRTKGIFDLIDIWSETVQKNPNTKLLIIGEGIDSASAKNYVHERNLDKNIDFAGVVYDSKQKFEMLASAKVFVLPSYEENWAIVIGEAMAAGLPVVCYDLQELKSVWGDSVTYAKTGDKTDFYEKMNKLLKDPILYENTSIKGRKFVKKYAWEPVAKRERELIDL